MIKVKELFNTKTGFCLLMTIMLIICNAGLTIEQILNPLHIDGYNKIVLYAVVSLGTYKISSMFLNFPYLNQDIEDLKERKYYSYLHIFFVINVFYLVSYSLKSFNKEINIAFSYLYTNKEDVLTFCLVMALGFIMTKEKTNNKEMRNGTPYTFVAKGLEEKIRTKEEIYQVAVHEAGHALLFGLLNDGLLNDKLRKFEIKVFRKINSKSPNYGYVHFSQFKNGYLKKDHLEWIMMMNLAGKEFEKIIFNDDFVGATTDMVQFNYYAHQYLQSGFSDVYYLNPVNDAEVKMNYLSLNKLKMEMEDKTRDFLIKNKEAGLELAKRVTEQEDCLLCYNDIKDIFNKIREENYKIDLV